MRITQLRAQNLRKIRVLEMEPVATLNFIWGGNGSGKTTLLEAVNLLNSGKSFRSSSFTDLVSQGETHFGVAARLAAPDEGSFEVRFQRTEKSSKVDIGGQNVSSASVLARSFPLLLVDPHSFGVVEGGPRIRRALLDRAVFHVERDFVRTIRGYLACLGQRNALLKTRQFSRELEYWNVEVARYGEQVHAARQRCVAYLNAHLGLGVYRESVTGALGLRYRQGWREGVSLLEALQGQGGSEWQAGQTLCGPHKAELIIQSDGEVLSRFASRGQIKTAVLAIVACLADYIHANRNLRPVMMVDDFGAELDDRLTGLAIKMIRQTSSQVFLTTIHESLARRMRENTDGLFHVEQGYLSSLS